MGQLDINLNANSIEVQRLRKYVHDALGWDYSTVLGAPQILNPLLANGMIFSRSGAFTFEGSVIGHGYEKRKFELSDVSAVVPPPPKPRKYQVEPLDMDVWDLSSFGKKVKDSANGFQGVILSLEHERQFKGKTIVRRDRGRLNPKAVNGLKRVGFSSSEFERKFEVYSSDQVEARHLLSPDFIERFIEFDEDYLGRNIQCIFLGNKFHASLDIDDRFDFSESFKTHSFQDAATRVLYEIGAIFYLLEKVQALQSRIGRFGTEGEDKLRNAFYKELLDNLRPAVHNAETNLPVKQRHNAQSFTSTCDWQHLMLQPRI